ncbi:hypothetical protein [Marimonas arenosa]|uniref:Uncharacterized protein n=1 Tax=Marimonas arenosa TaxID=1795305 RepID=A0AAE3WC71_9RHOB|nr:hypothetical protein [Marimonas arenosa]MDQ2090266.1 hypothetical protein [Marimonas arenosa]
MRHTLYAGLAALSLTHGAAAQTLLSGDHSVVGNLCVGADCTSSESFGSFPLKVKAEVVGIHLEDTTTGLNTSKRDWRILANEAHPSGQESFSIQDGDSGLQIFKIEAYAPSNALYIDDNGLIGFGTSMPQAHLHVTSGDTPALRLDQDGTGGWTPQIWEISANDLDFRVNDVTNGVHAFAIKPGDNNNALTIDDTGQVGLGTSLPDTRLHLYGDAGNAQFLVEETSTTTSPRTLLNLQNNGRPEIVMGNTDTGGEWSFGAGTNFILKQGAVGSDSSAKAKYLTLFAGSGDLEIAGQIITGGPTCAAGCDAVFSADYDLPSIAEHAREMYALGHLPAVGPTGPGQPVNLTDKMGRILNELEHAHIYIARQDDRIATLAARDSRAQVRIARLEALVQDLLATRN